MVPSGCYDRCIPDSGVTINVPPIKFNHWQWFWNGMPTSNSGTNTALQPLHIGFPGYYSLLVDNGLCVDSSSTEPLNFDESKDCPHENQCDSGIVTVAASGHSFSTDCDSLFINFKITNNNSGIVAYTVALSTGAVLPGGVALPGTNTYTVGIPLTTPVTFTFTIIARSINITDSCQQNIAVSFYCGGESKAIVTTGNGQKELPKTPQGLSIVPNPAREHTQIFYNYNKSKQAKRRTIAIVNSQGRLVAKYDVNEVGSLQIDVSNFAKDLYIVQMLEDGFVVATNKMIVLR